MTEQRTTWGLIRYFPHRGSVGFGGPAVLLGCMQRDLVERRGWFTKDEYIKGLALSQLAPGPLAAQLAICLGYCHGGIWGATAVGVAFVVPSFLMTVTLGASTGGDSSRCEMTPSSRRARSACGPRPTA